MHKILAIACLILFSACSSSQAPSKGADPASFEASKERELQKNSPQSPIVSTETAATVAAANSGKLKITGKARIGLLYFRDQPAHRQAVLAWLKANQAEVLFESQRFGYLDAELGWDALGKLIATSGNLGLDESSMMKLELEGISPEGAKKAASASEPAPADDSSGDTSLFGPAHDAGFGAKVEEFRKSASADLGLKPEDLEGQGMSVAVFDQGIDLSRTDVFGNRIHDFLIGDEANWKSADQTLTQFHDSEKLATDFPAGLEDLKDEPTLRFTSLDEADLGGADLNGSGTKDKIAVAIYRNKSGAPEARFRPLAGMPFGDPLGDFGVASQQGKPQSIDLYTGKYYVRQGAVPSPSAVGVKFRTTADGKLQVAFVGTFNGSDHGIANLHMVGGDYTDPQGKARYHGVAPKTGFLAMQAWNLSGDGYGEKWIPLARSVTQAAEAGADVIDLDIYTPGTRGGNDLLSKLLCRVTAETNSVPVVASHNFGPLPNTIQALAQSPCVLGIGAAHSVAALKYLTAQGSIDPALTEDDSLQTAHYSGRGFGLNGMFKPDIISPAYGFTAYGRHFIRFSGTSGATPTTAGIVALLKQAARLRKVELNFNQVKFLLQGSSRAVNPSQVRDGYGFTDLAAAWELFKKDYPADSTGLAPLALTGHQPLQFNGRPRLRYLSVNLERVPVHGSQDTPVPMTFWIEYAGASSAGSLAGGKADWLKFYEPASGWPTSTLAKDMAQHGETQRLSLLIDLSDEAWAALPAGDHVAIVKGVRSELAGGRNVDFLLPVAFTKGDTRESGDFQIRPLYADQYENLAISTKPGDELLVYGLSSCEGKTAYPGSRFESGETLLLLANPGNPYPHASDVMNGYGPLSLQPGTLRITARGDVVRLSIGRKSQLGCDGPVSARLQVRHLGFDVSTASPLLLEKDGKLLVESSARLTATGEGLAVGGAGRYGTSWQLKSGEAGLTLRETVSTATQFVIPEGTLSVRVVPANPAHFQGLLVTQAADGSTDQTAVSPTVNVNGLGSQTGELAGNYLGLGIDQPTAGETLLYLPATGDDGKATSEATIELRLPLPEGAKAGLVGSKPLATWLPGETKSVLVSASLPSARPASLKDFDPAAWSADLSLPISIEESFANSNAEATELPLTVWSRTLHLPVELR